MPVFLVRAHVLHQGAAEQNVQKLHASADAEQGPVVLKRCTQQQKFRLVSFRIGLSACGKAVLSVVFRSDIRSAGKQKAVTPGQDGIRRIRGKACGKDLDGRSGTLQAADTEELCIVMKDSFSRTGNSNRGIEHV